MHLNAKFSRPALRESASLWFLMLTILGLCLTIIGAVPISVPEEEYNIDEWDHFNAVERLTATLQNSLSQGQLPTTEELLNFGGIEATRGSVYYWLQAAIQLLLPAAVGQWPRLIVARLVSVLLLLSTVTLTHAASLRLFPNQKRVALLAAVLIGLTPTMLMIGVGVNLEIAGLWLGAFVLFLLADLQRYGFRWGPALLLVPAMIASFLLKGTTWTLMLAPFAMLILALPSRYLRWLIPAGAVLGLIGLLVFNPINQQGTAYWYYFADYPYLPGRVLADPDSQALVGRYAMAARADDPGLWLAQYLPDDQLASLANQTVTVGVWARALQGSANIATPEIGSAPPSALTPTLTLSEDWQFIAVSQNIPSDIATVGVFFSRAAENNDVLYDGAILVLGDFVAQPPPTPGASTWGGQPVENLLRNPNAEQVWPQAAPNLGFPYKLNTRIASVIHWQRTWDAWLTLPRWWLVTFWGSWNGVVPTLLRWQLIPLLLVMVVASCGMALSVWERLRQPAPSPPLRWAAWLPWALLGVITLPALAMLIYRADLLPQGEVVYIWSGVRHAAPAFAAFTIMLAAGLLKIVPRRWQGWLVAGLAAYLMLLNVDIFLRLLLPFYQCVFQTGPFTCPIPFS